MDHYINAEFSAPWQNKSDFTPVVTAGLQFVLNAMQ